MSVLAQNSPRVGTLIGLSLPWACFEQTADWEDRKEGGRNEAINQRSLSNSWGQKADEGMRETSPPPGRPAVIACAGGVTCGHPLVPFFCVALSQMLLEGKSTDFIWAPWPSLLWTQWGLFFSLLWHLEWFFSLPSSNVQSILLLIPILFLWTWSLVVAHPQASTESTWVF